MAKLKKTRQEFEYEVGDEVYKYSPLTTHDINRPVNPSKPNMIHKVLNKIEGDLQYQIIYLVGDEKNPHNGFEFNPTESTIAKAKAKHELKVKEDLEKFELNKAKQVTVNKNTSTTGNIDLIGQFKLNV